MGVIDSDYEGETQIMMSTNKPVLLEAGQRIAQLLLLPYIRGNLTPFKDKVDSAVLVKRDIGKLMLMMIDPK